MKILICAGLVLVTLVGCDQGNPLSKPTIQDQNLKAQILGAWRQGPKYYIEYRADNTYRDSSFMTVPEDYNAWKLMYVTEGNYYIQDGILYTENFKVIYADTTRLVSFRALNYEFKVAGNFWLWRTAVDVFVPNQQYRPELWGSWSSFSWAYLRGPTKAYVGRQRELYTFTKDSSRYQYVLESLDGRTFSYKVKFSFSSTLFVQEKIQYYTDALVEFRSGRMLWRYIIPPEEVLIKVE